MILTSANLVHYLLARGLVTPASVVDGDFTVVDMSRRNHNLQVMRKTGPGFFVKQVQDWEPHSAETLRREATCYWLAGTDPDFLPLAALLPKYHFYDPDRQVLVMELIAGAESLGEYHRKLGGRFPTAIARKLGTLLGTYHRQVGGKLKEKESDGVFPRAIPWVLQLHFHNPSHFAPVSAGVNQLLAIVGQYPEFPAALDEIRGEWRQDALIHGDMKWENCVVFRPDGQPPTGEEGEETELKIVDWELADVGDGGWDVGAVFQAYLTAWIMSMRIPAEQVRPDLLPSLAEYPLEAMQPAIGAFWSAYTSTLGADAATARALLRKSVRYGAARMIQTAWEYLSYSPQISAHALAMLQVSINVLTRPDDAVRHLLAIETRAAAA
ncbi:MAG TPA: hypothetical protein VFQ39_17495 [Longimicrobium sp.]|nr:hypothetical protein [Longimicrobium sp.]